MIYGGSKTCDMKAALGGLWLTERAGSAGPTALKLCAHCRGLAREGRTSLSEDVVTQAWGTHVAQKRVFIS